MNKIFNKIKDESGQALIVIAASLVLLFGVTAFTVDLGMAYNAKAELQAAADATALAAAQELPSLANINSTVVKYAGLNGVDATNVTYKTPYVKDGIANSNQIEVTCTRTFDYLFAKVLGFKSKVIKARAVAERRLIWGGETLPFLNIDDPYTVGTPSDITLWEKTGTGDFESLYNVNDGVNNSDVASKDEFEFDGKNQNITRCFLNGLGDSAITLKNGGAVGIEAEVRTLVNLWDDGEFIYVISLEEIPTDPVNYVNSIRVGSGGKVTATISLENIVLLKCTIESANFGNAGDRGILLRYDGSAPIKLATALQQGTYVPGFVNYDVRFKLVE